MPLLSVVSPVYHNEQNLPELLRRLRETCAGIKGLDAEFVFVDDSSGDGSFAVLVAAAAADPAVKVLRLSRNFGSNAAIMAGLAHTRGDLVVVLAADLQDPPELIPELVARWTGGDEVVLAARRTREDPFVSRLFAAAFNRLFHTFVFPD